jgi:hypothetical protein
MVERPVPPNCTLDQPCMSEVREPSTVAARLIGGSYWWQHSHSRQADLCRFYRCFCERSPYPLGGRQEHRAEPSKNAWRWDTQVVSIRAAGVQVIQQICGFMLAGRPSCRVRHFSMACDTCRDFWLFFDSRGQKTIDRENILPPVWRNTPAYLVRRS